MRSALEILVWRRANDRCEYCQMLQAFDEIPFELDHIIARQHGGPTVASNLCVACFGCNHFKTPNLAGFDKTNKRVVPLFNPRRHSWKRHFRWDGPILVGRTAMGRVTIAVLNINRPLRVELRRQLATEGVLPAGS